MAAVQREWTLNVGQRTAYERLAHLFCELFLRLRTVGLTREDACDFPVTQADLADATGLTSVHVNRMLHDLRRDGLIELQNRQLRVPDLPALMDVAMFTPNYLHLDREGSSWTRTVKPPALQSPIHHGELRMSASGRKADIRGIA